MKRILQLSILLSLVTFTSCNQKTPSASIAQNLLSKRVQTQSGGSIKLVDFDKIDGREEKNYMGEFYVMKYKATIEFTQDVRKGYDFGQGEFSHFYVGGGSFSKFHSAGSQTIFQEEMYLRKTENGWEEVKAY